MTDDLISRQAAIDIVDEIWSRTGDVNVAKALDKISALPSAEPERYMVTMAESTDLDRLKGIITKPSDITLIPLPKAEPEQRWIPVTERLPKENGDYLVTGRHGAVNIRKYEDGRWYGNWAVIAWMPLPEPWKRRRRWQRSDY